MFAGGLLLFLGGTVAGAVRAYRTKALERSSAAIAIVLLMLLGSSLSGITLLIIADCIILISLVVEHMRIEHPGHRTPIEARSR